MIQPDKLTNYHRTHAELEELLIFAMFVAGKPGHRTAKLVRKFLTDECGVNMEFAPFEYIRGLISRGLLLKHLLDIRAGCYGLKLKSLDFMVKCEIDLHTCSLDSLISIPGVGFKSAKMFLVHTRRDYRGAVLDVHILRYLREKGVRKVPRQAPSSPKSYARLERRILKDADALGMTPAEFDLFVWTQRAIKPQIEGIAA